MKILRIKVIRESWWIHHSEFRRYFAVWICSRFIRVTILLWDTERAVINTIYKRTKYNKTNEINGKQNNQRNRETLPSWNYHEANNTKNWKRRYKYLKDGIRYRKQRRKEVVIFRDGEFELIKKIRSLRPCIRGTRCLPGLTSYESIFRGFLDEWEYRWITFKSGFMRKKNDKSLIRTKPQCFNEQWTEQWIADGECAMAWRMDGLWNRRVRD